MDWILLLEQCLNGLQLGILLFLLAAGLTLVFGIMDLVNLAHGSLYMMGAYFATTFAGWTGSFLLGALLALPAALLLGIVVEVVALRTLYSRDHLDQVLATFGLILFFNELARIVWGPAGLDLALPAFLETSVELLPGVPYPTYRIAIIVTGLLVAGGMYALVNHTRIGMLIRAGASNRGMASALGVNIRLLYTLVFGLGETILILAFVVIVIGGIGSIRGAFVAAILVGLIDTVGRAFLADFLRLFLTNQVAETAGPAMSSMLIYILMAVVLATRPRGLFPPRGH